MLDRPIEEFLRDRGLRATPQRVLVVEALMDASHPDVETIFAYAQARQSTMSLATVYNVLDKLRAAGVVMVLDFHGRRYYDLRVESHDHVRCRNCGRLDDILRDPNTRLIRPAAHPWVIEDQSLVWQGLCPVCQNGYSHA